MAQYHSKKIDELYHDLGSNEKGLSKSEAAKRLALAGPNTLPERERVSRLAVFFRQFHSWFIYILLVAAGISFVFEKSLDAYIIIAIVLLNAVIGFVQESRAEHAMEALKKLIVPRAKALRDGAVDALDAADLVPGDVIVMQAGDRVPADARIIHCQDFSTQEASLTGESFPIQKHNHVLSEDTQLADRVNMVWMATLATTGTCTALVIGTGRDTAIGNIATSIKTAKRERTHFQTKTNHLALQLGVVAGIAAILTFVIAFFVHRLPIVEVFIFSVATLVSSIPEGLPAVLAIVLAIGAYRMAQNKAIVRHLPVIEDLSVTSVVITDKTGTLTQNTMTARAIVTVEKEYEVGGEGWDATGQFFYNREVVDPLREHVLGKLLVICGLCNNSAVNREEKGVEIVGDPTEASFLILAQKAGLDKAALQQEHKLLDQMPFSQATRSQSVLVAHPEREMYIIGGEEAILHASTHFLSSMGVRRLDASHREELKLKLKALAHRAMRVVACASRHISPRQTRLVTRSLESLTFIGFIGIIDPIRPEAQASIAAARRAGIRVIMATGDHAETAAAIGRQVGLITNDAEARVLTAQDMETFSKSELTEALATASVFARMTPQMKMELTTELQRQGKVVAMIGDGVNDAPALKKANAGIAMGTIGTDVAREASDIILSDDNFSTFIKAIEQGRLIFNNIRQTSFFMITTSIAEIVTILANLSIGAVLPLTAIQILWINLITDGIPNIALAAEGQHEDLLSKPPRSTRDTILSREVAPFLFIMIILMAGVTLAAFHLYLPQGAEKARTVAFGFMIFFQLFNVLSLRSLESSLFKIGIFTNPFITGALLISFAMQLLIMLLPFTQRAFGLAVLSPYELGGIILISTSVIVCVEFYKWLRKSMARRRASAA